MNGAQRAYGNTPAGAPAAAPAGARIEVWLWIAQRASAVVLALCVLVHLATIIYAVRHGLSGAAILGRTRGNTAFLGFYALYVLAIAVHAPIGLRTLCREWLGWRSAPLNWAAGAIALALFVFGLRAGISVFAA